MRVSVATEHQVAGHRLTAGFGPDRIAALLGLPASTVHRVIRRLGLERPVAEPVPLVRYELVEPGGLLHVDTRMLGWSASAVLAAWDWLEVLALAIDDATRLVYAELLPDERGRTTAHFLGRAVRWFWAHGGTIPAS